MEQGMAPLAELIGRAGLVDMDGLDVKVAVLNFKSSTTDPTPRFGSARLGTAGHDRPAAALDRHHRVRPALTFRNRHVRVSITNRFGSPERVVAGVLIAVTTAPNGGCAENVVIRTPGDRLDTAISLATIARIGAIELSGAR